MKNVLVSVLLICMAVLAGCSKVPAGNVGVKVYLLGGEKGVSTEELGTGRYWIGLNEELFLFPTFSQNYTWSLADEEAISFQTVEGMVVSADVGITYAIDPAKATAIYEKYRKGIDEITDIYLRNMVRDALVIVASTRKVESVYGAGKADMMKEVEALVRAQVGPVGINIEKIYWAGDLVLPPQVTQSLNAKIQATQMAAQRRNEVEQAIAEADKERERAQGEADAKLIVAQAEAKAITLKAEALRSNSDVATLNAIDKWDGKLPQYMGAGPVPFLNVVK